MSKTKDIFDKIHDVNPTLAIKLYHRAGFLQEEDIDFLVAIDRFMMVLIRCGCGRFLTPVQDVKHFIKVVRESKLDYVRDVSLQL